MTNDIETATFNVLKSVANADDCPVQLATRCNIQGSEVGRFEEIIRDLHKKVERLKSDNKDYMDTLHAITVEGLGLPDPLTCKQDECPKEWEDLGFISKRVKQLVAENNSLMKEDGWQNMASSPPEEMRVIQVWNGKIVTSGSLFEGYYVDHLQDYMEPQPLLWKHLSKPPTEKSE